MKALLNISLGLMLVLFVSAEGFAQPDTKKVPEKQVTTKQATKVDVSKVGKVQSVNPTATTPVTPAGTGTTTGTDDKGKTSSKVRTRAIAIDEEGVDEEAEEMRPKAKPTSGSGGTTTNRVKTSTNPK